jgi:hypothetical protein
MPADGGTATGHRLVTRLLYPKTGNSAVHANRPGSLQGTVATPPSDGAGQMPWTAHSQVVYWGDIDTHGFNILPRCFVDFMAGQFTRPESAPGSPSPGTQVGGARLSGRGWDTTHVEMHYFVDSIDTRKYSFIIDVFVPRNETTSMQLQCDPAIEPT